MALLTRPTENKIFGDDALPSELTIFGSSTQSTDVNLILNNIEAQRGWGTVGVNGFPPMEWFNALGYGLSYYTSYLFQQGIPTWTALQEYYVGSFAVGSDGTLYKSLTGTSGFPNIGNNPTTDTVNWKISSVEVTATTGSAKLPVGTTAQRDVTPTNGYLRYNSDLNTAEMYKNGFWGSVGGGAVGGGTDNVFNENGYVVTANYTIPAGKSAVTVGDASGDVTINSGVTVTLESNSRWVVL
jgi:hypothetical protein